MKCRKNCVECNGHGYVTEKHENGIKRFKCGELAKREMGLEDARRDSTRAFRGSLVDKPGFKPWQN